MGTMPPRISKCHALVAKGLFLLLATCASQTASGQIRGPSAKPDHNPREIARFFIDEAKADSGYETGPLHIVYDDGTDVQATVANGWFVAWWPSGARLKAAQLTTPAGVSTQTFNLPSGCNTNKVCPGGNTVVQGGATGSGGHSKGESLSSSQ